MKKILLFIFLFLTKAAFAADFVVDSFTDTDNTPITSHTAETGGPWSIVADSSDGSGMFITSAYLWLNAQQTSSYVFIKPTGTPATNEYDLTFTVSVGSGNIESSAVLEVYARYNNSPLNGYRLLWNKSDETWKLYVYNNGVPTLLGSYVQALSSNTAYNIVFQVRNAAKKVIIDSIERISSGNNDITALGNIGIIIALLGANGSIGPHFDAFTASDFSGAPPSGVIAHRIIQ